MARRRAWSPPAQSAHIHTPAASLAQHGVEASRFGWVANSNAHITIYRPPCSVTPCRMPSMVWCRCRCRTAIGRCHEHEPTHPLAAARADHATACAGSGR